MSLYENSLEVARSEDNYQSPNDCTTYEEPVPTYAPNSDSLYSSLGNSTLRSCKNTTFPSAAAEERHYEKASKVGTSNNCLKVCLVVLFVSAIISLCASATALALYFKVSDDFKSLHQNSTDRITDLVTRVTKFESSAEVKLRKSRMSLRIYDWFQSSNGRWYKIFRTKLSYKQAKEDCEALDANLASTGFRNTSIKEELLSNVIDQDIPWFWIGIDRLRSGNEWTWSDDEVLNKTSTVWERESPSNESNLRCGLFFLRRQSIRKHQCTRLFPYLCETANPIL